MLNFTKGGSYLFALDLVPLNLIFTILIVLKAQSKWNQGFIKFGVGSIVIGFFVEVLGVNYGLIFGQYSYGEVLGTKLFNTPLLIGLNWFLLTYGVGCLAENIAVRKFYRAVLCSIFLIFFDYFLEPVAIKHDFWSWENGNIPYQNYVGWLGTSFVICLLFQYTDWEKGNRVASAVFLIQFLFFLFQNIL